MPRVLGTAHEAKLLNGNWPATGFCNEPLRLRFCPAEIRSDAVRRSKTGTKSI